MIILTRQHKIEVNVGAPQVAYRETITKLTEIDYTHKKQTGGSGQFARVKFIVEPGEENTALVFEARSLAATFRRNTCPASKRASIRVMTPGHLRVPDGRREGDAD